MKFQQPSISNLPSVIVDIIDELRAFSAVEQIILFGSRARGDHEQRSDIDLAVSAPTISEKEWQQIQDIIDNAKTLLKIEVVRLETTLQELRQNILKEGVILYDRGR